VIAAVVATVVADVAMWRAGCSVGRALVSALHWGFGRDALRPHRAAASPLVDATGAICVVGTTAVCILVTLFVLHHVTASEHDVPRARG
jgi:hypothetical protein